MAEIKAIGVLCFVNDYGSHRWEVWKIEDGCYYFYVMSWDGNMLRYNEKEQRIEEKKPGGYWDVFDGCIFQADYVRY